MRFVLGLLAILAAPGAPKAQDAYPARPITMIVPFAAGGTSDVIARLIGEEMSRGLNQRIVHENMAGAGGSAALLRAAKSLPDGYTIFIGNVGTNAAAYSIYNDLKYGPDDFVPIGLVAKTAPLIAVRQDFPAADLKSFLDFARKNPGKVTLGHAGVGSSNYLICRSFIAAASIEVSLVSYRGAGPALNDLMGSQIDGVCDAATSLTGAIAGGKARGLVASAPARLANLPQVPTAVESGVPEFQAQGWNALFAPKGTPDAIIAKLNAALRAALQSPSLRQRFADLSSDPPVTDELDPVFVQRLVPMEIEKYRKLLAAK